MLYIYERGVLSEQTASGKVARWCIDKSRIWQNVAKALRSMTEVIKICTTHLAKFFLKHGSKFYDFLELVQKPAIDFSQLIKSVNRVSSF